MADKEATERLNRLRQKIIDHLGDDDLRTLCFSLGLDYHDLPGESRAGKIRELVTMCDHRDHIADLIKKCAELFPNVNWSDAFEATRLVGVPLPPAHGIVGRDEMLADLRARLMHGGPVALTALDGKPGVGKTTLAVALAHDKQVQAHFTGGVLWAGLGPNPSVDDALSRWAEALGGDATKETTTEARAACVRAALKGQPFLIVLDDVWGLTHAEPFRRVTGPGCACLLTTRDETIARHFAPQQAGRVEELPQDQAVELLAALVGQAASLPHESLRKLARAVGGLPLALTLVGGYLLDHVTFAAEADKALAALERTETWLGLQDTSRRLSLEEVIALSVDALPEEARRAFAGLAAFAPKPATFSIEAAQAVTGANAGDLGLLARRNLLEAMTPERATLHPALAAVAERRAGDAMPDLRQRHAQHYLDFVNRDRKAWRRIEPELEQIRFAWAHLPPPLAGEGRGGGLLLAYVGAMDSFLGTRGLWRENLAWCERGLTAAREWNQRQDEGTLLNNIAWCCNSLGERRRALDYYEQALPICREVGDRAGEAVTRNNIGLVYRALEENNRALEYYEQALPISREVGDRAGEAATLNNIGLVYDNLGERRRALEYLEQALTISREVGDRAGEATTLNNIGGVYCVLGERRRALEYYEQALTISRDAEQGDRAGEATTLNNIGGVYYSLGERRRALEYYEQALPISREVGNRAMEATTLNNIGAVYDALGERRRALEYYEQALPIRREVGDRAGESVTLFNVAMIYESEGNLAEAARLLEQVVAIDEAIEHPDLESDRAALEEVRRKLGGGGGKRPPSGLRPPSPAQRGKDRAGDLSKSGKRSSKPGKGSSKSGKRSSKPGKRSSKSGKCSSKPDKGSSKSEECSSKSGKRSSKPDKGSSKSGNDARR